MREKEKGYLCSYSLIFNFLLALLISYIITAAGVLLLAYLLLIFHIPMGLTDKILYGIYGVSVWAGVIFFEKKKCYKSRFGGILLGLFYCSLLFILSAIINSEFQLWEKGRGYLLLSSVLIGETTELFLRNRKKS